MRSISRCIVGCYLGLICATALCDEAYHFVTEIPIGGEGGWDILTIDSAASRLYLSHATKVVVVDLNTNSVTGEIADTPGVHAFVAVPEVQRGFSSNGKESKSSVVDLTTLKTTSKIDTGQIRTQLFTSHVMVKSTFSITPEIRSPLSTRKPLPSQRRFRSEELQNSRRWIKQQGAFTATSKTRAKSR